jgi:transposase InsO family protein
VKELRSVHKQTGLSRLCSLFGYTRQAYYDWEKREEEDTLERAIIIDLVLHVRKEIPRIGARALHLMLHDQWEKQGIKCGRDRLIEILRQSDLLIYPKRKYTQTTDSRHYFYKYPNLIKDLEIIRPEQLWVSDLTYIRVENEWNYVIFITDAYSRKIMGFRVDNNMKTTMCVQALDMALVARKAPDQPLIHHSDRGVQYCSKGYVTRLLDQPNVEISMTENGDPLENAIAERVNGIFKDTYNMDQQFESLEQAQQAIAKMVDSYNNIRPHSSCDMMTPNEAHQCTGALKRRWKTYYKPDTILVDE